VRKGNNGYYGVGWTNSFGSGWQHYSFKIGYDTTFLWSRSWGAGGVEKGEAIAPTSDGGFVVAGEQSSNAIHGADAIVYKFNATGDTMQWCQTYSATLGESASAITQTQDGNIVVSGLAHRANGSGGGWLYDLFLMKLDGSNGNMMLTCLKPIRQARYNGAEATAHQAMKIFMI
jgi:outer membrane protein assembly factor BamB